MKITPLVLKIIIHYYCSSDDYKDRDFSSSIIVEQTLEDLYELGLLDTKNEEELHYKITDKGKFYVKEGLCKVLFPFPKETFIIPEKEE